MKATVQRMRWFGAELLIVVAGVLIALAAQGWWQRRDDLSRERSYLRQLSTDLARTISLMSSTDADMRTSDAAIVNLLRAFRSHARPPDDSIRSWLVDFGYYQNPAPVTSTAEALVSTGDLRLIRDESLRSAITAYLGENRNYITEQNRYIEYFVEGVTSVYNVVDVAELRAAKMPQSVVDSTAAADRYFNVPPGARRTPFPVDVDALLHSRTTYNGLTSALFAKWDLSYYRARMREGAQRLEQQVDSGKQADRS